MMTAPTGTSPTSQALWAWSSAMRIACSSAGVIGSRFAALSTIGALLQRLVGRVPELLLDVLRLLRHREAGDIGRRRAGHAARDGDGRAVAHAGQRHVC